MDNQKVSDLTTIESAGITDYIPILTDEVDNVVEKIKVDDFVNAGYFTDRINEIVNNAITANTIAKYNTDYPIGSIYIGTMSQCPIPVGTWELVAQDRVLQGAGSRGTVGTTVDESLPNIKGTFDGINNTIPTGAFGEGSAYEGPGSSYMRTQNTFDASRSSSTYQDNAPVQQDAYIVNIWERVA